LIHLFHHPVEIIVGNQDQGAISIREPGSECHAFQIVHRTTAQLLPDAVEIEDQLFVSMSQIKILFLQSFYFQSRISVSGIRKIKKHPKTMTSVSGRKSTFHD